MQDHLTIIYPIKSLRMSKVSKLIKIKVLIRSKPKRWKCFRLNKMLGKLRLQEDKRRAMKTCL